MKLLNLESFRAARPDHLDVDLTGIGTIRVKRTPVDRRLAILQMIESAIDDDGKMPSEVSELFSLWAQIVSKTIVDDEGNYCFDNPEGVELLAGIAGTADWHKLVEAVNDLNRIGIELREADLEEAKNE